MNINQHPTLEELTDYVHGELPPPRDAAVHAHIAGCAACTEAHDTEVRLGELLREHARAQERELPLGFARRIVDAATTSEPQPARWWETLTRALRPAVTIPALAAVALAVYLAAGGSHQGTVQMATIDAATYIDNHAALATDMPFAESSTVPMAFASTGSEGEGR